MSEANTTNEDITTLDSHAPAPPGKDPVATTNDSHAPAPGEEPVTTLDSHAPVPPALDLGSK
ncbi:sigma-like protein [Streptomyces cyanogenus]|uniref:Sigma-like protein n=1 Tax=Streptomyces cyanogenus TaxID=80860 RepID=A0ABX7TUP4_STRCY|nr:sigma-like protein [Streptomyces cyanogenus]QTD99166.1 hypothetical protein S1361_17580 [Streptomyces cyanogenus]